MERTRAPRWTARVKEDGDKLKVVVTGVEAGETVVRFGRAATVEGAIGAALHVRRAHYASNDDELATIRQLLRGREFEFQLQGREIRSA